MSTYPSVDGIIDVNVYRGTRVEQVKVVREGTFA